MSSGFCRVAEAAIRERERIVNGSRAWIDRERLFEMLRRARVVAARERGATETDERRDRLRIARQRAREQRFRALGPRLIEVRVAEPDERRQVVGLKPARALEGRDRFHGVAARLVQMAEIVRPAGIFRRQPLRVDQTGFRRIAILRRHEQFAHLAEGGAELRGRDVAALKLAGEQRILRLQLRVHPVGCAREIGHRHRLQRVALRACRAACDRGHEQHRRHSTRDHLPVPSFNVV